MPAEPQIKGLSKKSRNWFFWILFSVFVVVLPTMIFYTTGYRLSFEDEATTIITTGGIYITTTNREAQVYLDDELVEKPRLFRSAYYIQNISTGQHRIVVQQEGLQTWVKEIPVDPYIVTEAISFNLPEVVQLRPVTQYLTATGSAVYIQNPVEHLSASASITEPYVIIDSTSTRPLVANQEYVYVESLFEARASSTATPLTAFMDQVERFRFTSVNEAAGSIASTTIEKGDMRLYTKKGELYAGWVGQDDNIPFYFCVSISSPSLIAARYGTHVREAIFADSKAPTSTVITSNRDQLCRTEIKLDRERRDVYSYNFMPGTTDLVLLHRSDGLFVTEIDDRAWQNTEQLYGGENIDVALENDTIYLHDGGHYFEIIPNVEE